MARILLIEDDPVLGPRLKRNLELSGYRVTLANFGKTGLNCAKEDQSDLIILDLMLPGMDGMRILHEVRQNKLDVPVIILTAKGSERDKLAGFREGCDDYMTKPFSFPELTARIRAVLKRCGYKNEPRIINSGGISLDPESRTITGVDAIIELSPREFDLLYFLVSRPNQTLSRYALLDEIWGEDSEVTTRTIDAHVSYLRKKLADSGIISGRIATVYKAGYMWSINDNNRNGLK